MTRPETTHDGPILSTTSSDPPSLRTGTSSVAALYPSFHAPTYPIVMPRLPELWVSTRFLPSLGRCSNRNAPSAPLCDSPSGRGPHGFSTEPPEGRPYP